MTTTTFVELSLSEPIQRAVAAEGYTVPTPIQAQAIPHLLSGRDLLGCAQTGTGKTAAFALPILERLATQPRPAASGAPRVLVLSPTRELAAQIGQSFQTYGRHVKYRQAVIFGGVGQHPQVRAMARGVHVLVATPGRLLDLINQGHIRLDRLEVFVLDEADRMLDMGFLPDLRRIVAMLPQQRQSLFFSATMPPAIASLAGQLLQSPVHVEITPPATTVDQIEQRVMFVDKPHKRALLCDLLKRPEVSRVLVFTKTKRGADLVAKQLNQSGVNADAIHGNKSQNARGRALGAFKSGRLQALVATDLAARGIDVEGLTHVVNYDLPLEPESYVHRIGRTGRAGATGVAVSFCDAAERNLLRGIERLIRRSLTVDVDHNFHSAASHSAASATSNGNGKPGGDRRRDQGSNRGRRPGRPSARRPEGGAKSSGGMPAAPRRFAAHAEGTAAADGERATAVERGPVHLRRKDRPRPQSGAPRRD